MTKITRCNICGNDIPEKEIWQATLFNYPKKDMTPNIIQFDICLDCKEKLLKGFVIPLK